MSSTVLSRAIICTSLVLISTAVLAKDSQAILSCDTKKVERKALAQAPRGARRIAPHVLEVVTDKGPRRFVDTPPHDEDGMSGIHWRYCGYNVEAKAHLVELTEEGLFSGDLVSEQTGKLLRAGHTVLFAPNRKDFLAIEQKDGVDGEHWAVYDLNGKAKWAGYAGTIEKVDGVDTVVSTFDHPRWTKQGELTARHVCASSKASGVVTLTRLPSGSWNWLGHEKCS